MLERKWSPDKTLETSQRPEEREFISVTDVLVFIRRYLVTILVFTVAAILLALAYIATTDPVYTAQTEVLIEPKLPTILQQQPAEINLSLDTAQIESQIVVMQSEKIAQMVIDRLHLTNDPSFNRSKSLSERGRKLTGLLFQLVDTGKDRPSLPASAPATSKKLSPEQQKIADFERARRTMATLRSNLDVRRVGVSYAIQISYSAPDAELAAKIANAIAEAYVREQLSNRTAEADRGTEWLESRISQLRTQMNNAAQAAQAFRARHDYRIGGTAVISGDAGPIPEEAKTKTVTLEELEATTESYRKMYESFLQAFTSSANQQPTADARVITSATRPLAPSQPRPKLILALGALAGIMLGAGVAFGRQMLDRSILSAQQIKDECGLDCIGSLPTVFGRRGGFGRFDEMVHAPGSVFSQSVKDIRARIGMIGLDKPIRILGVTSTSPGDGKSTLITNLAAAWSMSGARTLFIDADAAHGAVTKRLASLSPERVPVEKPGDPDEIKRNIVSNSAMAFDILPSPVVVAHNLLLAGNLQRLLGALDDYEMIFVDLPPFTAGEEGLIASSQLDAVVVTAQWGRTPVDLVSELIRALHMARSFVVGIVLTKVHDSTMGRLRRRAGQAAR